MPCLAPPDHPRGRQGPYIGQRSRGQMKYATKPINENMKAKK